jgi:hypothetical protein
MSRYVLRYQGEGPPPAPDLERIRSLPGLEVLASSPRLCLVEATAAALGRLREMPAWAVCPESTVGVPDTRKKARRGTSNEKDP